MLPFGDKQQDFIFVTDAISNFGLSFSGIVWVFVKAFSVYYTTNFLGCKGGLKVKRKGKRGLEKQAS